MNAILNFLFLLILLVVFAVIVAVGIVLNGYNQLRSLSESIKEALSNIGVVARKQVSLVNQLIDVVKGYQESEKLVMLKISEDVINAASVTQMYQQSGMVLSSVNGLAEKFPALKADQQYQRLIDSIQMCESQLEGARSRYNREVRNYNVTRSSIPNIFFAPALGFNAAPYLEFIGNEEVTDIGTLQTFFTDDDGTRLNEMFARAASQTLTAGKTIAAKAIDSGKALAEKAQEKIEEISSKKAKESSDDSQKGAQDEESI